MPECQPVETELAQRAAPDQTIDGGGRGAALDVVSTCENRFGEVSKNARSIAASVGPPVGRRPPPFEQVHLRPKLFGGSLHFEKSRQPEQVAGHIPGRVVVGEQGAKAWRRRPQFLDLFVAELVDDDRGAASKLRQRILWKPIRLILVEVQSRGSDDLE